MDTRSPRNRTRSEAPMSRGKPGRRLNLAMLVGLAIGVLAILGAEPVAPTPERDRDGIAVTTRGIPVPLHRQEAVAGADRLQRPACPIPSRVGGELELRIR